VAGNKKGDGTGNEKGNGNGNEEGNGDRRQQHGQWLPTWAMATAKRVTGV
jgi:hypothetical protein